MGEKNGHPLHHAWSIFSCAATASRRASNCAAVAAAIMAGSLSVIPAISDRAGKLSDPRFRDTEFAIALLETPPFRRRADQPDIGQIGPRQRRRRDREIKGMAVRHGENESAGWRLRHQRFRIVDVNRCRIGRDMRRKCPIPAVAPGHLER